MASSLTSTLKQQAAEHHRQPNSWLTWLLMPASFLYGLVSSIRVWLYDCGVLPIVRVNVPVISVGNLTTGGTGKTPVIIALAKELCTLGHKVVILSRGYGASHPINYGKATNPAYGDEAYLIQQAVPQATVIVGKNRSKNAQKAVQDYQPDVILLDDGYQHMRLGRDVNLLLIDGNELLGNKQVLPAGPLREPLGQIKRADAVLLTKSVTAEGKSTVSQWVETYCIRKPKVQLAPFETSGLRRAEENLVLLNKEVSDLTSRTVATVCGIAHPEPFETAVKALGFKPIKRWRYSDHHRYTVDDVRNIQQSLSTEDVLITTGKDWVKLASLVPESLKERTYVLETSPQLSLSDLPLPTLLKQQKDLSKNG
ncbi:MAG: tetraacyldisaccharide 4'-kinase [Vampirovibrio sp.]|nr:tetraacyldisaccharide 4'-kinase [Vampirovibrio sp.]